LASIDDLTNVDLKQGGLSMLKDAFDQVRTDLGEVKKSATDEYADDVDAVDHAATSLLRDLSAATNSPSAATIQPLATDLQSLEDALIALRESGQNTCRTACSCRNLGVWANR
jgi:hypothetical protein